ncbi:hypothetical protein GCM10009733_063900 [Nonomuraea maheshkhaliensis]|uniref:Zinc-finger domain-containing protein n=1 Tax=Nonomuraea maheshkhaliensis TaxID=419590 RepID=A0ABN2FSR2_9ACTN
MKDELHTLSGAYAVHALPYAEWVRFEQHLHVCQGCSDEVRRLRETAAKLAESVAEPPPTGLRGRLLAAAHRSRGPESRPDDAHHPAARPGPWPGSPAGPHITGTEPPATAGGPHIAAGGPYVTADADIAAGGPYLVADGGVPVPRRRRTKVMAGRRPSRWAWSPSTPAATWRRPPPGTSGWSRCWPRPTPRRCAG